MIPGAKLGSQIITPPNQNLGCKTQNQSYSLKPERFLSLQSDWLPEVVLDFSAARSLIGVIPGGLLVLRFGGGRPTERMT